MKENASPLNSFVTAFDDSVIMDDYDADDENTVSFAHLPVRTSPAPFSSNKKHPKGFRETLAAISNSPLLQDSGRYALSPTKTSAPRRGRGGRKAPRIEILKQEMSSSKEMQSLIHLRRAILVHLSIDKIHDATVPNEYGSGSVGKPFPRLLIDGQDVGGLESVMEFEADGVLGQMLKSSSFTRGFLQAGPCPPEEQIQLARDAYSAVEDLRQSLDSCVERKILQERSKQAQNIPMSDDATDDGNKSNNVVSKPAVRLRHSWDAGSNFIFRRKNHKKDNHNQQGFEEATWDPCDLRAIAKGPPESPSVRDSIKHLLLSASKKRETETEENKGVQDPLPLRSTERRGLRWKPFLLGMIAVPAVVLLASKGIAPILCTAGKQLRRAKNSKRRSQLRRNKVHSFDSSRDGSDRNNHKERHSGVFRAPQLQRPTTSSSTSTARYGHSSFAGMVQSNFAVLQNSFYSAVSSSWSRILRSVTGTSHTTSASEFVCVEKGDSLWNISCDLFGDGLKWRSIAKHNQIQYPFKISVGQCLELPPEYAELD